MSADEWRKEAEFIAEILNKAPVIDRGFRIDREEFKKRQQRVVEALEKAGLKCAIVYSDEHYNGDVPYSGKNEKRAYSE